MNEVNVTKDVKNKTLTIERVFDASKEKLWRAYADKAWFEKWWGPEGWETSTKEFDFREGGRIHYCMKCVDKKQGEWFGQEAWGIMEIESIIQNSSFSAQDFFSNADGVKDKAMPSQRFEVELVETDGKTRLVSRSITETEEQLEELVKMGMVEGFSSQLNKLEQLVKG